MRRKIKFFFLLFLVVIQTTLTQTFSKESSETKTQKWTDYPDIQLPNKIKICSRYDSNRDECIKNAIQTMIPILKDGFEPLGITEFDPFVVEQLYFEYKQNQVIATLNISNAKVVGMSEAQVLQVRSNLSEINFELEFAISLRKIYMEGKYKGEGRFNEYKVKSKGFFNVTYSDVYIMWQIFAHLENRHSEYYMKVQNVNIAPVVGHIKVFATGIFPDPVLNQLTLDFINEYWPYYYQHIIPETRKSWEPVLVSAINQIFDRVPFRKLMTDSI